MCSTCICIKHAGLASLCLDAHYLLRLINAGCSVHVLWCAHTCTRTYTRHAHIKNTYTANAHTIFWTKTLNNMPPQLMLARVLQIIQKAKGYDLRLYEVFPVVTMSYENRAEGYGNLGNYIGKSTTLQAPLNFERQDLASTDPLPPMLRSQFPTNFQMSQRNSSNRLETLMHAARTADTGSTFPCWYDLIYLKASGESI